MKLKYKIFILTTLVSLYCMYSASVYFSFGNEKTDTISAEKLVLGKMLWQKYNCQSCHQLYGLGGYLGPDLTNCYSNPHKGPAYMDAILQSGIGVMPDFELDETERIAILEFLKQVDASGYADPKKFTVTLTGNIYPDAAK